MTQASFKQDATSLCTPSSRMLPSVIGGVGGCWESLDHLVGAGDKRRRHFKAERLCGLEIDHQFELGRGLHRKVGRFLALENAIDIIGRGTEELIIDDGSIGYQAALGDLVTEGINCGQSITGRQSGNCRDSR